MPGYARDGGAEWLLQVLRHPPVVLLLEVARRNDPGAGADGEFLLVGAPANGSRGAVDAQQHERRFPAPIARGFPDVGVTVLRAGHDAAGAGGDVDARDGLVVAAELVGQLEAVATVAAVELDVRVPADGQCVPVRGEGVVRDRGVEEVVGFWGAGHGCVVGLLRGGVEVR